MNKNLTEIILVVDRSGSMGTMAEEATNGINDLVKKQKEEVGDANFTLVQFNNEIDTVYARAPIQQVKDYKLVPRNMTALMDAVGSTINSVGDQLAKTPENERPGLVTFVIVTDGCENSSQEFTTEQVKSMIEHQQTKYNWQFTYMGANQDSFAEAKKYGINFDGVTNYTRMDSAYKGLSGKLGRMRTQVSRGLNADNTFTDDEINEMTC